MTIVREISRIVFYCRRYRHGQVYLRTAACAIVALALSSPLFAAKTTVHMEIAYDTNQGTIDIELYDDDQALDQAPKTVANFLRYAGRGYYTTNGFINGFIHRSAKTTTGTSLLIQGGGYAYITNPLFGTKFLHILEDPPIQNEFSPSRSNLRGTIAMAKIPSTDQQGNPIPGGGADSATSEWFINVADNGGSPNTSPPGLDYQNGGFTVFGKVIDTPLDPGMTVVDAIANLQTLQLYLPMIDGSQTFFGDLPLANYDPAMGPQLNNLVKVTNIPNVTATITTFGTTSAYAADVDMTLLNPYFNPNSNITADAPSTVDTATSKLWLATFTPPSGKTVQFNDEISRFTMSETMGPAGRVVTLYHGVNASVNRYYAYGPTPDNNTPHWYDFTFDGTTGAEFVGGKILLHFVDGQRGDDDLNPTNNSITHTGAPVLETDITTSSSSSYGCSIAGGSSQSAGNGDWVLVSLFLAFVAIVRRRARQ